MEKDSKKKRRGRSANNPDALIESKNSMYSDLLSARWLYNPVVYSQLSGDFTLMQQRILIGIIEKLQQRILDSVDAKQRHTAFPAIFEESELMNRSTIELMLTASDLGVVPELYGKLEEAAKVLSRITMKYPKFNEKGRVVAHVVASLFPRIEIDRGESDVRRTGMLRVVMLTENIRDIFTMQHGFVKHVSHIARIAMKKRTPRLYIYLSRFKDTGRKKVPYSDLVEFLGLTDEYYKGTNDGKNPYTSWSKVKMLVMEPVRKEMDDLAARGEINFSFTYEPIFPHGKTRGIPQEVLFTIVSSEMGRAKEEEDHHANAVCHFIDTYCRWCPDISITALRKLLGDLPEEAWGDFSRFALDDVRKMVERKQPDDVASYVMGILRRWKSEHISNNRQTADPMLPFDDFEDKASDDAGREGSTAASTAPTVSAQEGALREEWGSVLEQYDGLLLPHLRKARHWGTVSGFVLILFPDEASMKAFQQEEDAHPEEARRLQGIMKAILGDAGYVLKRDVEKR